MRGVEADKTLWGVGGLLKVWVLGGEGGCQSAKNRRARTSVSRLRLRRTRVPDHGPLDLEGRGLTHSLRCSLTPTDIHPINPMPLGSVQYSSSPSLSCYVGENCFHITVAVLMACCCRCTCRMYRWSICTLIVYLVDGISRHTQRVHCRWTSVHNKRPPYTAMIKILPITIVWSVWCLVF